MTRHEHGTNPRRRADRWSKGPAQPGAPEPALPAPVAPAAFELQRRSFLRLAGFGFLAAGAAACSRGPSQKAVALLAPSEDVIPGRNYRIATTTWSDGTGSGVLLTCRDGRPIKVEGNPAHPCGRGALSPVAQASILSLYDGLRLDGPRLSGRGATWDEADAWLRARLEAAVARGGAVRLLTSTLTGPSTRAAVEAFLARHPGARHVTYDALSCSALLDAEAATRGVRALPALRLDRAEVLATFDADVLGTWIAPAAFAADRARARRPDGSEGEAPRFARHWHFESRLSLTGSRADRRVLLAPWELAPALALLATDLARRAGATPPGPAPAASVLPARAVAALAELAGELWAARGRALVACGRNERDAQLLAAWSNELLGAEGATRSLARPALQRQGDDRALQELRDELLAGKVDVLVVAGANPAYDLPGFEPALARAGALACTSMLADETAALAHAVFPEPHEFEAWDDAEPLAGVYCTSQPALPALRGARTLRASLARWGGDAREDRALLADHWRAALFPRAAAGGLSFERWFEQVLERGFVELPPDGAAAPGAFRTAPVGQALERVARAALAAPPPGALGLVLYPKVGLLDGRGAHNPWLQELPDPVAKTVWDNHADLAPAAAARLGVSTGDLLRLDDGEGGVLELPALVQPGQDERVVAVALGYGRLGTDRFTRIGPEWIEARPTVEPGGLVGRNAAPWLLLRDGQLAADARAVRVTPTGARRPLACTQDHHSLHVPAHLAPAGGEVRDAVRLMSFEAVAAGAAVEHGHAAAGELWADDHPRDGHRWGLAIDLSACTGCSACVVACQAENNVPVVGRDEVARHREMSWIRIDRYYADDGEGGVQVAHQPMMCQHCGHAPCETVCPVLATVHSSEGLNQQVYNRCVGTRYCANNCPYKTRRFNWFEYAREDRLRNLSLNPDVTVRSRGVMEKCSLCVQRIQAGKAAARRAGRPLADGEVQTACQQGCPTQAIAFGDLNDPQSAVSRRLASRRAYEVLGELNVQPSVRYLADVRHAPVQGGSDHG